MGDFDDELKRRVQGARDTYQQGQEQQKREMQEQADRDELRKARARTLMGEIQKRLQEAADGSDGAMKFGGSLVDGIGQNAYDLMWEQPPPKRGLRVSVNYFDGIIQWTWLLRGEEGRRQIDALDFDAAVLNSLILGLADQSAWGQNRLPSV